MESVDIAAPRLGEMLLADQKLSRNDLERALEVQRSMGGRLGRLLISLGLVSEVDVYSALSRQAGLPLVRQDAFPKEKPETSRLNTSFLLANNLLPLGNAEDAESTPDFASVDPKSAALRDALRLVFGDVPRVFFGLESEISSQLNAWYVQESEPEGEAVADQFEASEFIEHLRDMASEAPIIQRVSHILSQAVAAQASDIHIETYEEKSVVRIRVDGELYPIDEIDNKDAPAVVSRIKILSQLDIAERRMPQDGRTKLRVHGKEMDSRVSTIPTMFGESVVMRLLEKNFDLLSLESLHFTPPTLKTMRQLLSVPHGIFLVTGPTGSGKSTTLYASMQELEGENLKILTVEDPVEYRLQWLNQVQVQPQIGLTFAKVLRSFLRQDPDVIMIGEMRDGETAEIAVQAALTGHLVMSTLHTNSALGAIVRLINMGVEPYLITASVIGVLAQRLVRKLCEECKAPLLPDQAQAAAASLGMAMEEGQVIYRSVGCSACRGTGYRGRLAVHELLVMSEDVKKVVLERGSSLGGGDGAYAGGNLLQDGATKVFKGLTTAEEVLRVARQND
ncbi:MAG: secretion system protein E [Burkholderiales bacterium RIFCSPHIGHO2_01_FULL_64_960]|nr:MAG: secretion system protein E [Burkholderiales bacterium RIFCSPHIGHO2_01_FULL_64_960]OGA86268.1 MAG: secretion system protein E [Burkholderiales bacterium GWA2_64_37]OGB10206.1 MAG: secretion system protein E [Burkholderiales bacterium RIFCSPHIGHO2_12_FULL_65_48]OGB12456.1 MAG: secretion system protein E [Burkholderiales bacterium RIFCSPHIGHO2_02_FULL_64_19]OGB59419.1 MAG: secretion system protein E [Burkholderiales bacterium RIFCSPLOWO2_12_FULL_64_33]HCE92684.1 secretion system protein E